MLQQPLQGESFYSRQDTMGFGYEGIVMPYRWKKKVDVDESIVVIKNVLDETPILPDWLLRTIHGAIADSEPELGAYFFKEVERYAPSAMKYFERGAEKIHPSKRI